MTASFVLRLILTMAVVACSNSDGTSARGDESDASGKLVSAPRRVDLLPSPGPPAIEYGWWLTETVAPTADAILGISVSRLDTMWLRASVLTAASFSQRARVDLARRGSSSPAFSIAADFNGNGREDRALVGVYTRRDQLSGNFILVVEEGGDGWRVAALFQNIGIPAYSGLTIIDNNSFAVWNCLDCGDFVRIAWVDGAYRFQRPPADPDAPSVSAGDEAEGPPGVRSR